MIARVLLLALPLLAQAAPGKAPVPPEAEQKRAEKLIRDLFKDDYKASERAARRAFAAKLVKQGVETQDDPVSRFVMLREARDIAAEQMDLVVAFEAIDKLAEIYDVKADDFRAAASAAAKKAAKAPEDAADLAVFHIEFVKGLLKKEDFDDALKSARDAEALAKASKDVPLQGEVSLILKDIPEFKKEKDLAIKAELALSANAADADASLRLGRYLCFSREEWAKGLALLARAAETTVRDAAMRDATSPADPAEQAKAGDAWLAAAEKERGALDKRRYQGRARHWYEKAQPGLTGLARVKVDKALETLDKIAGPRGIIDLLRMVDLSKDTVSGRWSQNGSSFLCPGGNLQLPYLPPDEYDLKLVVTMPPQSGNTLCIGLPGPDKQAMLVVEGGGAHGLEIIDRQLYTNNETTTRGAIFIDDKPRTVLCSVRRNRIVVTVEGKKIVDWVPDWSKITLRGNWVTPEKRAIFIGALGRPTFNQVLLTPLSGQGKKLR
jgi:hypothetical protein